MPPADVHSSETLSTIQRRVVLAGMMGGVSLAALDQMVLSTAVSAVAGELGDISQAPWIFTANLLTSAASMPIWGKLGDLYGRRRVFQCAILLFIATSLLAAQSPSMITLLLCRAGMGLGGGALLTMPYAILGDVVSPRERPAYVALISLVWTTSGFIGPPLGGFLVDGPGWRWMFYINVPAAIVAMICIQWGYRIPRRRIDHRVDFAGAALIFSAVGCLILYTSWAGETLGWTAPLSLSLLAGSAALGVAFVVQERRAAEPILELSLLRMRPVWPPLLATFVFGFGNFTIAFFLPLFSIVVRGTKTVEAGFTLAPLTAGLLMSGIFVGRRAVATGFYRRYASGGLVVYIAGLVLLVTADRETPDLAFLLYSLLLGLGSGSLNPIFVAAIQNAVEERYLGVASSLPGFARAVAQTIGTSMLGAFLALRISHHLAQDVAPIAPAGVVLDTFVESPASIRALSGPLEAAVIEAYRVSFAETYGVMIGVMALSLLATRFMRDPGR